MKVVAIVVIGGLGAFVGPVLGALWVVGIPAIWPDEPVVPFLVSGVGILAILLFAPGGLAGLLRTIETGSSTAPSPALRHSTPEPASGGAYLDEGTPVRRCRGRLAGRDGDDGDVRGTGRGRPRRPPGGCRVSSSGSSAPTARARAR